MKNMIFGLALASIILGGCSLTQKPNSQQLMKERVETRVGTITTKTGDEYLLNTTDGIVSITSKKVNLDEYMKKPVRVSGMFSGSTLYVDKIESAITN